MDLSDAAIIFYCFSMDLSVSDTEKMLPHVAHTSIVRLYAKLSTMQQKTECTKMEGTVDGDAQVVEIDESLFGKKQKYNRGRPTKKVWIFGLVERGTRKTYFTPVTDRSSATLLPIIKDRVSIGTMIYHDDWAVYRDLHKHGFQHDTVVHTKEFVSQTGACTNTIEGTYVTTLIFQYYSMTMSLFI